MSNRPDGPQKSEEAPAISGFDENIPTPAGELAATVHLPVQWPCAAVVCCHGLLSHRGSQKYESLGRMLAKAGVAVVRFDFTGCGESRTGFADSLLATRIRDVNAVLAYVRSAAWFNGRLGLFGSSMGGFMSGLTASSPQSGVAAAVTLAAPFNFFSATITDEEMENILNDFQPRLAFGTPTSLTGTGPPSHLLIIHGKRDDVVPWSEAETLYHHAAAPKRIVFIDEADHAFTDPEHRAEALRLAADWFLEHLSA